MDDKVFCPRAVENGGGPDSPFMPPMNGEMSWRDDQTCSYCGSLSPAAFFERVEAGEAIVPTDKNYKAYVAGDGPGRPEKMYFQHFSEGDKHRFIALCNDKRMKFAAPGHFYVRPFFCSPA